MIQRLTGIGVINLILYLKSLSICLQGTSGRRYASNKRRATDLQEKDSNNTDDNAGIRRLINSGLEIAGGAVGGTLGFLAGGPVGEVVLGERIGVTYIGQHNEEHT